MTNYQKAIINHEATKTSEQIKESINIYLEALTQRLKVKGLHTETTVKINIETKIIKNEMEEYN